MPSPANLAEQERSMIVEARLTHKEAAELYESAQRLRSLVASVGINETTKDILKICNFIQENI